MPENYSDLLKSEEWQSRRVEILARDNHTCQRCGINSENYKQMTSGNIKFENEIKFDFIEPTKKNLPYEIVNIKSGNKTFVGKTYLSQNEISKLGIECFRLTSQLITKDYQSRGFEQNDKMGIDPTYNIFAAKNLNKQRITAYKKNNPRELDFSIYDIDLNGFWLIDTKQSHSFNKTQYLHVHHNCYRKGLQIWNQPESDYISLCNICHKIIHEYFLIPFYDIKGRIIQYLEFCDRCDGLGEIPCYRHVSGGICFKCHGAGILNKEDFE